MAKENGAFLDRGIPAQKSAGISMFLLSYKSSVQKKKKLEDAVEEQGGL